MGFVKDEAESKGMGQGSKCQARRGNHMSEVTKIVVNVLALEQLFLSLPKSDACQKLQS